MNPEGAEIVSKLRELTARRAAGESLSADELAVLRAFAPAVAGGDPFKLEADGPRVTAGRVKYPRELSEYAGEWGVCDRTLKRWVSVGRNAVPMDLPPLHRVQDLPAWFARHHRNKVPDWLFSAAAKAAGGGSAPAAPVVSGALGAVDVKDDAAKPGRMDEQREVVTPFDLASAELDEGEAVLQAKGAVKAAWEKLLKAYAGQGGDVDLLQSRHQKALSGLRQIQASERKWLQDRGSLIPKAGVLRDLNQMAEAMRMLRESMVRQVLELCPGLDTEQRAMVGRAIERVRGQEDVVLRNLKSLKHPSDVVERLAA